MATDPKALITRTLQSEVGSAEVEALLPLVYDELRQLARSYLRRERPEHTLQPTALVHEAFEKLVDQRSVQWQGRSHFLAIAAIAMRRLLLQHAEKRRAAKRGGGAQRVTLDRSGGAVLGSEVDIDQLLDLDTCLRELAERRPRHARLVELRVFAGLTMKECAAHLGVPLRTAEREWRLASAWLRRELAQRLDSDGG